MVRAAIERGKDVYTEWPLTTTTQQSEELLALAEEHGVRHVVGLQRRFAPSAHYLADLLADGYVGTVRGVRMSVGVDAFPARMPQRYAWTADPASFTNVVSIYAGHFSDLLFHIVGWPEAVAATTAVHVPTTTMIETGEQVASPGPDEAVIIGSLAGGALLSIHIEGAQRLRTGLQIDITGTDGVLRVTNPRAYENKQDNTVWGMNGSTGDSGEILTELPVPARYRYLDSRLEGSGLDASTTDTAYLYSALAQDVRTGSHQVPGFADAVRLHHLIDAVTASATGFDATSHHL